MRAAPPVELQLAAGRLERGLITLVHGLAGLAIAAWIGARWPSLQPASLLVMLGAFLAAGLGWRAARAVLPAPAQRLVWTGQAWLLQGGAAGAAADLPLLTLQAHIDLGHWVLLRYRCLQGRPGWLVASVQADAGGWHLFRVALQAHGGALAQPASPDAARPGP